MEVRYPFSTVLIQPIHLTAAMQKMPLSCVKVLLYYYAIVYYEGFIDFVCLILTRKNNLTLESNPMHNQRNLDPESRN